MYLGIKYMNRPITVRYLLLIQVHELKKNGKNIQVTETNKKEYVKLYVNYRYLPKKYLKKDLRASDDFRSLKKSG